MSNQKSLTKQDRMLPPLVAAVLLIRDKEDNRCPEEILSRIDSLKIGKVPHHFKGSSTSNQVHLHHSSSTSSLNNTSSGAWRSFKGGAQSPDRSTTSSGFRQGSSWERPLSIRRVASDSLSPREEEYRRFRNSNSQSSTPSDAVVSPAFPPGGRYVSSIVSDKNVEDRIIGHIRSKLNKFSNNNYDGIKSFLEQIMNSGETDFITEFMDLLFTKAASEEIYCELYARLLSELTEKFPHLVTEIGKIYSNFILIFQEARDVPDQGSGNYTKFLDAQIKKKFRYGYSNFLAEIYNKNLLPDDAVEVTVKSILDSLSSIEKDATNTLLVEEYLASLHKIITTINTVKTPPYPPYVENMLDALKKIVDKPKESTAGYTTKARFKIMDIIEYLSN